MAETTTEWTIGAGRLAARVRRRWRVVLAVLVLTTAASGAAGLLAHKQYSATASVTVSPIRLGSTYSGNQDLNISTEKAVIGSRQVAEIAAASLKNGVAPDALVAATSVAAPSQSTVLQVTVTSASPRAAADEANAIAAAYLTVRAQTALDAAQASIDALNQQIAATNPKSTSTLANLRAQLTTLQHVGIGTAHVIGRASVPTQPSSLGLPPYLVGGAFGGLILGVVLARGRDLTDRRIRFASRYSELMRGSAVVVRGLNDLEGARWILRGIRRRAGLRRPVVAVTALDGTADEVVGALSTLARHAELELRIVDAESSSGVLDESTLPALVDAEPADLVLVNASRIDSGAALAMLADAVDAVIVVGSAHARVARATALRDLLEDVAPGELLPVYLVRGTSRPGYTRPDRAAREAARASARA
ncbi:MAG: Wzz/FepE/Etk N-terminal domain-containing protein [Amnibacterium sp.]